MCGWHGIKGALIDRSIDWLLFTAEIRVGYTPQSPVLWWWILLQLRIRRQNSQCGAVTIWDIEFLTIAVIYNDVKTWSSGSTRRRSLRRRSLILIPIESPCATYISELINTNLTVFLLSRSIGQIIVFGEGVPLVNASVLGKLFEYRHKSYAKKLYSPGYIFVANSML